MLEEQREKRILATQIVNLGFNYSVSRTPLEREEIGKSILKFVWYYLWLRHWLSFKIRVSFRLKVWSIKFKKFLILDWKYPRYIRGVKKSRILGIWIKRL